MMALVATHLPSTSVASAPMRNLSRAIEAGELTLGEVVTLTDAEVRAIEYAFTQVPPESPLALKPVFDAFAGKYDYGLLRCVRAAMASP